MKVAAYCRVSTDKNEQLSSLKNQQEFFRQFAEKNGHILVKIYSDEGISGKHTKNRTGFLQMMSDAENHLFDMVVVKDISRFARNTLDFLTAIRKLKTLGIETVFLSINQTVLCGSEFMLTLFSAIAQEESANLSSRVKFGKKQNALKGKVPNFVYGYDRIDNFTLKINDEQAKIVKKIFSMYLKGYGSRYIANHLTEKGVPTLKNLPVWSPKTVRRMLENPLYAGTLVSKKTESLDFLTGTRRKLDDTKEYTFQIDALKIIDKKTFEKVQKIIQKRAFKVVNGRNC